MRLIPVGGGEISTYEAGRIGAGTYFEDGDFLLARITPSFENGKQGIATRVPGGWGIASTEVYAMRSDTITARYLSCVMRHPGVRRQLVCLMEGATGRMRLPRRALEDLVIPIPPTGLQEAIAGTVEHLMSEVQAGAAAFSSAAATAARYEQSLLAHAMTGRLTLRRRTGGQAFLSEILAARDEQTGTPAAKPRPAWRPDATPEHFRLPEGWVWATIDQLTVAVQYGTSARTIDDPDGVPVLRMGNVRRGWLDWDDLRYLQPDDETLPATLLAEGDVLFNRTNSAELVGKTALVRGLPGPTSFASYLIRLVANPMLEPAWLSYWLNSPFARRWARDEANQQTGQANISGAKLRRLAIPLPPADVHRELCTALDSGLEIASRTSQQMKLLAKAAEPLRQAVLVRAMSGRLAAVPGDQYPGCR